MHALLRLRTASLCLLLLAGLSAAAQPVVDGTVNGGEYPHSSGDWSMAWDDTYVYVAKANATASDAIAVHLDVDPQSTPNAGTAANGSVVPTADLCCGGAMPYGASLPFRGDVRALFGSSNSSYLMRDGAGNWTAADSSDFTAVAGTNAIELRIRWDGIPGLSGRPESFNWLAYQLSSNGTTVMTAATPSANPAGSTILNSFWSVASTAAEANPFATRHLNVRVSDSADSGSSTLRGAITTVNADADVAKRFITFNVNSSGGPVHTLGIDTSLPAITRSVTLDGTTDAVRPVITGNAAELAGLALTNVSSAVVRGLGFTGLAEAIVLTNCTGCTIGGQAAADRNVIGGNEEAIAIEGSNGTLILNNYVGVDSAGTSSVPNVEGIDVAGSTGVEIRGNIVSGNTTDAITTDEFSEVTILGNYIGVGVDGVTAIPNGGIGIETESAATIGSVAAPNIIANNAAGVIAVPGNLLIRGNSIYANSVAVEEGQPVPTLHRAAVAADGTLGIRFSLASISATAVTQSLQLDLYAYDNGPKQHLATSPCFTASSLTNAEWIASPQAYAAGNPYVLMATSYEDANCTNVGDGTSEVSAVVTTEARKTTSLSINVPDTTLWSGQSALLYATLTGAWEPIGTVTFTDNGTPIPGCTNAPVISGEVQCGGTISGEGSHSIVATFSGDGINSPSTSAAVPVTVSTHVFTGTGNFGDPSRWSGNTPPAAFEHFVIDGTCTFNSGLQPTQYGTMTLNPGAILKWTTNHSTPLRVTQVTGSGAIDMTGGGTLELSGMFDPAATQFTRGIGTVRFTGAQPLPGIDFYNLVLTGSVASTGGAITIHNALTVGVGAVFTPTHTVTVRNQIANFGTLQFAQLTIPAGATLTASSSFSANTLTVNGTLIPAVNVVLTGALNGTGTVYVTGTATPNSFGSQYSGSKTLADLTVRYEGTAAQSIDTLDYGNLTINTAPGVNIAANTTARVFGTLTLLAGPVTVSPNGAGELSVENTSTSSIAYLQGWIVGEGFSRMIAAGTNVYLHPVGTAAGPAYANITYHDVPAPGRVQFAAHTAAGFGSRGTGSGLDPNRDANVYWRTSSAATFSSLDVSVAFGMLPDAGALPTAFVLRALAGATWLATTAMPAPQSINATGVPFHQQYWFSAGNQLASAANSEITTSDSTRIADGTTTTVTVRARDTANFDMSFGGDTVALSTTVGTLGSVVDAGNGTYTATLSSMTIGTATITGTINGVNITDNATVVFTGRPAASLLLTAPATATPGTSFTVTVTARDSNGNAATGYTGTVALTSSDSAASLPANYTFVTADGGVKTFTVTLNTPGNVSITATDTVNPSLTSTALVTVNAAPFGSPPFVSATATSASSVTVSWSAVSGATGYRVFRSSGGSAFTALVDVTGTSHVDGTLTANTSYLYKVAALSGSTQSALSGADAATTIVFTDTSLSGVRAKAVHLTELRTAINAMRVAAGLSAATFSTVSAGTTIQLSHITELRTHLNAARAAMGLAALSYTDPTLTARVTTIKAAHVMELRAGTQ